VTDQRSAPIDHASVRRRALTPDVGVSEGVVRTFTDGRFELGLPPAEYRIWIALPDRDYQSPHQQVTVRSGEAITLVFVLQLDP